MRRRIAGLGAALTPLLALFGAWAAVTQPVLAVEPAKPAVHADPVLLRADVVALVEALGPRHHADTARMDATAAWIADRFGSLGLSAERQPVFADGRRSDNVLTFVGPADGPRIVVGAHYDAHRDTPGADDNASGVAGLLELARILAASPPPMRVDLVAFTNEEPPYFRTRHMGSRVHAASIDGADVRLMLSLEMIGAFDDARGSQRYPFFPMRWVYPRQGDFIGVVGRMGAGSAVRRVKSAMLAAGGVPVEAISAPRWVPGIDFSDHASYWAHDVPAVMVTDTAFYRNPRYHEPTDLPDTLDYVRMAAVVDGVVQVALSERP